MNITKARVACGVIIKEGIDGDEILVLKRSPDDHWPHAMDLPRGKCDGGNGGTNTNEKLIRCLRREVKEETGLDIDPLGYIDQFTYMADRGTRETTQYNFLCQMKDPKQEVRLSREHSEYIWVSSMGQIELMLMPEMKKTVSKVFNNEYKLVDYGMASSQLAIDETINIYLEKIQ